MKERRLAEEAFAVGADNRERLAAGNPHHTRRFTQPQHERYVNDQTNVTVPVELRDDPAIPQGARIVSLKE